MTTSLGYSEINSNQTLTKIKQNRDKGPGPRKITSAETEKLYKQLHNAGDDEDDDGLPNLLKPPAISSQDTIRNIEPVTNTRQNDSPEFHSKDIPKTNSNIDNCVSSQEQFSNIQESYVPYTTMPSNQSSENNTELMERLNYMIYLLEEQKDEKTGTVNEEMILYAFLGVFVIFIVDSFARAGKYSR